MPSHPALRGLKVPLRNVSFVKQIIVMQECYYSWALSLLTTLKLYLWSTWRICELLWEEQKLIVLHINTTAPFLISLFVRAVCLLICFVHFCLQGRKTHTMVSDDYVILCAFISIYLNHIHLGIQFVKNFIGEGSISLDLDILVWIKVKKWNVISCFWIPGLWVLQLCFVYMKRASPLFSYSDFKRGAGRRLLVISEGSQINELELYVYSSNKAKSTYSKGSLLCSLFSSVLEHLFNVNGKHMLKCFWWLGSYEKSVLHTHSSWTAHFPSVCKPRAQC